MCSKCASSSASRFSIASSSGVVLVAVGLATAASSFSNRAALRALSASSEAALLSSFSSVRLIASAVVAMGEAPSSPSPSIVHTLRALRSA